MQYRVLNDKDEIVYVNDRALIVRNKKGKAMRMIGAMTDITERKNFEKQLIELNDSLKKHTHDLEITNQELEQFAYIASHDLQEPLRMVTSFMDLLKRRYEDQLDDKALQYIHFATDGAKRMKQIILDLLEYSRAGKLNMAPVKINTNKILEDYQVLRKRIIAERMQKRIGGMTGPRSLIAGPAAHRWLNFC
jgi:light-regulated signal transduction histidine kinase (bacteriophytochrome)